MYYCLIAQEHQPSADGGAGVHITILNRVNPNGSTSRFSESEAKELAGPNVSVVYQKDSGPRQLTINSSGNIGREAVAAAATREAVRLYPDLGIKGSALYRKYMAEVQLRARKDPTFLSKTNWPLVLVKECAAQLKNNSASGAESTPAGGSATDTNSTVSFLKEQAAKGSAEAEFGLALYYLNGNGGVVRDLERARQLLESAAGKGHIEAKRRLKEL
jgi:TPR repeat protein